MTRFSTFLSEVVPEVGALAGFDRAARERYLAWLATSGLGHGAKDDAVASEGVFFQAVHQHRREPSLPTTGDLPPRPARVSRRLAEHVMAQVEAAANLDR